MQQYFIWPGAYSFKDELQMLLEYIKEQIEILLFKLNQTNMHLNGF